MLIRVQASKQATRKNSFTSMRLFRMIRQDELDTSDSQPSWRPLENPYLKGITRRQLSGRHTRMHHTEIKWKQDLIQGKYGYGTRDAAKWHKLNQE